MKVFLLMFGIVNNRKKLVALPPSTNFVDIFNFSIVDIFNYDFFNLDLSIVDIFYLRISKS